MKSLVQETCSSIQGSENKLKFIIKMKKIQLQPLVLTKLINNFKTYFILYFVFNLDDAIAMKRMSQYIGII